MGPRHRVRRDREPVGAPPPRSLHADRATRATRRASRARSSSRSSRACPVALDGERMPLRRAHRPSSDRSSAPYGFGRIDMVENRRVGIKSREVYECPAALALILAHRDLESRSPSSATSCARSSGSRSALRRARLRRPVALAAHARARRVHRLDAGARDRRGAAAARSRAVATRSGGARRAASTTTTSPPTTPRTRSATRTPRASCASGASRSRPGRARPGPGRVAVLHDGDERATRSGSDEAAATTLWHGRFAEAPSDELLAFTVSLPVRRAPRARRPRRLACARRDARARRAAHRGRARR